ncbi:MAG: hypothetical protein OHK93_003081 [Ramalina farinacea]|uniref:DUF7730 domain-containing protein n=1 Tax=Ramalina farinacea TaxID=258253 RepID=A0AA43QX38_9LECA|nr:hypothetical protein [Ramalina farinacea]
MSQRAESDVIRSPLLRLPAEIRQLILHMIIGGKTIHLIGRSQPPFPKCRRSLCIAPFTSRCAKRSPPGIFDDWSRAHHKCVSPRKSNRADAERIDFYILSTNRQIHYECFQIFWRTSRFCFVGPKTLAKFLASVSEGQKQNVKHLVILYRCASSLTSLPENRLWNWNSFRSEGKDDLRSNRTKGKGFYFPNLATIELHLRLESFHWEVGLSYEAQVGAFLAAFAAFEVLRLIQLKAAFVALSYAESTGKGRESPYERLITNEEGAEMANKFRDCLLDPVLTDETLMRPLIDDIKCEIERLDNLFYGEAKMKWGKVMAIVSQRRELLDALHGNDFSEMTMILGRSKPHH